MKGEGTEEIKLPELVFDLLGLAEALPSPEMASSPMLVAGRSKKLGGRGRRTQGRERETSFG